MSHNVKPTHQDSWLLVDSFWVQVFLLLDSTYENNLVHFRIATISKLCARLCLWLYLKAVEYTQVLAGRPVFARLTGGHASLCTVHTSNEAKRGTDSLVGIQEGEPSLAFSLPDQELAPQPLGRRGDSKCLGAGFHPPQQHALLIQAEEAVAGPGLCLLYRSNKQQPNTYMKTVISAI